MDCCSLVMRVAESAPKTLELSWSKNAYAALEPNRWSPVKPWKLRGPGGKPEM